MCITDSLILACEAAFLTTYNVTFIFSMHILKHALIIMLSQTVVFHVHRSCCFFKDLKDLTRFPSDFIY